MRLRRFPVGTLLAALLASPTFGEVLTNCAAIAALPRPAPTNCVHAQTACITGRVSAQQDPTGQAFFVFDDTGCISVRDSARHALSVGSIYRITGQILSFKYGTNALRANTCELVRKAEPPPPAMADFQRIRDGQLDGERILFSGLVIDAFPDEVDPHYVRMLVRQQGVTIPLAAHCSSNRQESCRRYIGREISGVGFCVPPAGRRRFGVSVITVGGLDDISIAPDDTDVFAAPFFDPLHPGQAFARRCQEGTVLARWGDRKLLVIAGTSQEFEVHLREDVSLPAVNSRIRVSGFLERNAFFPRLIQAVWRPAEGECFRYTVKDRSPREILAARDGAPAIESRFHGRLIRLTGTLRNVPARMGDETRLYLESDGYLISVDASAASAEVLADLVPDMTLAVVGLCLIEHDESRPIAGLPRLKGFSLVLRGDDDIRILARPPWWTPARLLAVIGSLAGLVVAILIWLWWLNRQVDRRSRELAREQIAHRNAETRREERTRLAVELHDSLSQNLAAVAFQISSAKSVQSAAPPRAAQRLVTAEKMLDSCRAELRACLGDLRSSALEQRDFEQAILQTVDRVRCDATVSVSFPAIRTRLTDSVAHALLMILRELVSNAARHGRARQIDILGKATGGRLEVRVTDDGCGFDIAGRPGIREGHFGVEGIRQRVKRLKGTFTLDSTPSLGTTATLTIPLGDRAS